MNLRTHSRQAMWLVSIALMLVGCGAPAATPTPLPPTPTPLPPTPAIEVTFDGHTCTVSGPAELPPGEHLITLKDRSGLDLDLHIDRLDDGYTFQDVLNLQAAPGERYPFQDWMVYIPEEHFEQLAEGERVYTLFFRKEAEYCIQVGGPFPEGIWLCAPLQVVEAPSE